MCKPIIHFSDTIFPKPGHFNIHFRHFLLFMRSFVLEPLSQLIYFAFYCLHNSKTVPHRLLFKKFQNNFFFLILDLLSKNLNVFSNKKLCIPVLSSFSHAELLLFGILESKFAIPLLNYHECKNVL